MNPTMRFVHKQLQTAFNTVTEQYELWKTTEASIQSCLKEIVCTAENLQHVQKAKIAQQLLEGFSDSHDRLVVKMFGELDSGLENIERALTVQSNIVATLDEQEEQSIEKCNSCDEAIDDEGNTGEWPSICYMLQALQKIHRRCFNIHHLRKFHVDNIEWTSEERVNSMAESWTESKELTNYIQEVQCMMQFHQSATFS